MNFFPRILNARAGARALVFALLFTMGGAAWSAPRAKKGEIVLARLNKRWMPAQIMAMDHRFAEVIFLRHSRRERLFMADFIRPLDWKPGSSVVCRPTPRESEKAGVITRRWPRSVFVVFPDGRRRMRALRFCRDGRLPHEFRVLPSRARIRLPAPSPAAFSRHRTIALMKFAPPRLLRREARALEAGLFRRIKAWLAEGHPVRLPDNRVLFAYDDRAARLRLRPRTGAGETRLSYAAFLKQWKKTGYAGAVLIAPGRKAPSTNSPR